MTDDKKGPDDAGEVDWDSALSDWETKTFVPEVAKDVVTDKPATLSGQSVSRPLYRPPQAPPPRAKAPPPPPRPSAPRVSDDDDDDGGGATLISQIPRELLRRKEPTPSRAPAPPAPTRSGGLGQFFAREERRDTGPTDESHSKSATRARGELLQSERERRGPGRSPPPAEHSDVKPLQGGSREARTTEAPGADAFDPFSEPRPQQLTLPADSELADLLEAPVVERKSPSIHAPETRRYDPEDETVVGKLREIAPGIPSSSKPPPSTSRTAPPPVPRSSSPRPPPSPSPVPAGREDASGLREVAPDRRWENERPASAWLDEATRLAFTERAEWLEEEARALDDDTERARALLSCCEIHATTGDRDRAAALAREARDLAPDLALAHRQVRGLLEPSPDAGELLKALDAEIRATPPGAARTHAVLFAADAAAAAGSEEEADRRFADAARVAPSDVRVAVARAARTLRDPEGTSEALGSKPPPAAPGDAGPISEALRACLVLRGIGPADRGPVLMRARNALDHGDLSAAASLVAELAAIPEIARGALWLAAALGSIRGDRRPQAAKWLRDLVDQGEVEAFRPLAARTLENADAAGMAALLERPGPISSPERLVLGTLAGVGAGLEPHLDATASAGMEPLACAAAAVAPLPSGADPLDDAGRARAAERAKRTAGASASRHLVELGRILGTSATPVAIEATLEALGDARPASARAVALEMAARTRRISDVSATLEAWGAARGSDEERAIGSMAAGLVAERAGDRSRALQGFKAARAADGTSEAALRAIASLESVDLVEEMSALADELGEGVRGAVARLEAVTLGEGLLPEPTQAHLLEGAHRAAPELPIAAFLAERIARKSGDVEQVLAWIRSRRAQATDATDGALDAVREALHIADSEPALAAERLREAHQARPADVALRELYERMAPERLDDRASWREARAAEATGRAHVLLLLEASREAEQAGDEEGALRCAEAAAAEEAALAHVARERAELRTGRVARLADELFSVAKSADDPVRRREAFERLAELDLIARRDPGSALLWHRSIFEDQPDYKPSLRYLEQHLLDEGRDDELEPIASAIAVALHGTGSPESTAHAELAARLRMRGATGSWEATRDLAELAASESEPSLWALRMLQSHSRARGDDAAYLAVTKRLVDRATQPLEIAALLLRCAEAAARLGKNEEALAFVERAAAQDPNDVVAWDMLAEMRRAAGDARGCAEACEAVAKTSVVPERQLVAWYSAGQLWQDEVKDEGLALPALEAAAAIDVAYADLFDRLSHVYASRQMQSELAQLLERRMESVTDPEERRAIEVRRGRVLFEAGDVAGAREAYETALAERPDDAQALAAFTDLCLAQSDWEVAEQSLIRLARLLPTPDEQRVVYAQLGELYAHHLLNLPRAEVALKEVLKCAPDDVETAVKLVEVYRRQGDAVHALELQQELLQKSRSPEEKRQRLVELSLVYDETANETRKAEQVLEGARREFPQDVVVLRALAEFYSRHKQTPAFNILLDRAGADARRALTAGRLTPASFEVLATVHELRGRADAARVSKAMLATLEGQPVQLAGAGADRAFDARLDDLLAPEVLTAPLRGLLAKTGDALDAVSPIDVRLMKAAPIDPESPLARLVAKAAESVGLGNVALLTSSKLGAVCMPVGSAPPTLVIGEAIAQDERVGAFLALRALKLVRAKASALGRTVPGELGVLVSAWLKCFNPSWSPQGINPSALTTAMSRIQAALPKNLEPEVGAAALEIASAIGTRQATLGPAALAWANRVAFLALGDPNAALDAIASAGSPGAVGVAGPPKSAPRDPKDRAAWVARTPEARDLVAFGVTDAFAEARARLGLDG